MRATAVRVLFVCFLGTLQAACAQQTMGGSGPPAGASSSSPDDDAAYTTVGAFDFEKLVSNVNKSAASPYAFLYGGARGDEEDGEALICKRGCVDPDEANLAWCANQVNYVFCNRTLFGPREISVLNMEEGAIAAYMAIIRKVPKPGELCKKALRNWMCYEYFNRCTTDGVRYFPVCKSSCASARFACGNPVFIDCDEEIEELEDTAPPDWYQGGTYEPDPDDPTKTIYIPGETLGSYIRGQKPNGQMGTPIFEADQMRCTGGKGLTTLTLLVCASVLVWALFAFDRS